MLTVTEITPQSLAEQAGIQPGDRLISINRAEVHDFLDYHFLQSDQQLRLIFRRGDRLVRKTVTKEYDKDLGLRFPAPRIRACSNDCLFCFIRQNPPGMRRSIYFCDEDYRYSFLYGNYITLTNLGTNELERIARQRLSPLYVSIHATDDQVRQTIFRFRRPDHLPEKLAFLTRHGIELHTQIVVVPDVNDGDVLEKTIADLNGYGQKVRSIAVVPVGLTCHRQNLPVLRPVDRKDAQRLFGQFNHWRKRYLRDGLPLVYLADEFYLLSGRRIPGRRFYGDFPQYENGVGIVRHFLDQLRAERRYWPTRLGRSQRWLLVTGELAAPILRQALLPYLHRIADLTVDILPVRNDFYGSSVTVAGLLAGGDIVAQIGRPAQYDLLLLPPRCLNQEGHLIDDYTIASLQSALHTPVCQFPNRFIEVFRYVGF